jgi:circadian clock protein KaiB
VKQTKPRRAKQVLAKALTVPPAGRYVLRLFVAGATDRSRRAILRVGRLCESDLKGRCDLEVIDIYQQPGLARENQIVATPTLIKESPPPPRRFIGDLSNLASLLVDLNLTRKAGGGR